MKLFSWIVFAAVLLSFGTAGTVRSEELPLVTAIEVKGVKRIEEGSLRSRISQKIGTPLSSEKTTEDIKTIFKMGYFDDVRVDIEPFEGGIKVIYIVKEKPTVIKVDFQGNKKFGDDKLREHITLSPGAIADVTLINDNAGKIRAFYEDEGYYLAAIIPVVRKVDESEVAVTFQIDEGKKVKIKSITIDGNKALSDRKIKKAMKTKERDFTSFVLGTGYYKKEEMRADLEHIKDLYFNNGYIKVLVGEPFLELTKNREGMKITIPVAEGDQYKVSGVEVAGNKAYSDKELRPLIKLAPNTVFNKDRLSKDVTALSDKYSNNGYALVSIYPDLVPDEDKRVTKVIYRINEGDRFTVGRIDITGNTRTRDKVIRREVRLDEGEIFNASALKRSYERLNNLQYFETVDISPKPKPELKMVDLDVTVKEKPTGFLSVGGGYSSVDKFIAMVDITQGNLFGRGQYLKLKGELGGNSSFYELSFRDPWFLDRPLSFGAGIYKVTRKYDDFDRKATGIELSLGKSFGEYWSASTSYVFEKARITGVAEDASSTIKDQEGSSTTSSIGFSLGRDSRDNYLDPSRGSKNALYFTFAGLGGTNKFLKVLLDSGWYFPVFKKTTFAVRGRVGYATGLFGEELPLYERYYVGGIYTVRGIGYGEAGPRDINASAIGGEKELIFNFEYIFPIVSEYKLKGLVFFDAGRAYGAEETFGSDLRYTAGTGIRWISPMGPLRIEWGYNIDKRTHESASKVEFTFGSFF
ncbi:MAG: outer membrane protein assembly factor BamA [Thermodesulfovibrionales bacterium]